MASRVVGVDACRLTKQKTGWVAVTLADGIAEAIMFFESFRELCDQLDGCDVIAVDIPIGFPDGSTEGVRRCDEAARTFLRGRAASVFKTPPRAVLKQDSHEKASALNREQTGKGISIQMYSLRAKILEVDEILAEDNSLCGKVFEVHPEVSFSTLVTGSEVDVLGGKKTWLGQVQRSRALMGEDPPIDIDPSMLKGDAKRVPADDLYDAAAAARTALRIAGKQARTFPDDPGPDEPTIWY